MTTARTVRVMVSAVIGIVVWELCARVLVRNPLFLPTPDAVLASADKVFRLSLIHI